MESTVNTGCERKCFALNMPARILCGPDLVDVLMLLTECREVRIWFTSHLNVQLPSVDIITRGQNWGTGI